MLLWLGAINLLIGLFNLIPGFFVDGGRVLGRRGGRHRRLAEGDAVGVGIGEGIGRAFVVAGIAMAFGIWVPFWHRSLRRPAAPLHRLRGNAASQAEIKLAIDNALAGHTVADLMTRTVAAVPTELPVSSLCDDHFVRSGARQLPVVRGDRSVGIESLADVRATPAERWAETPVGAIMHSAQTVPHATPEEPLGEAFEQLARKDIDSRPVLAGDRLVGVLQRRDVVRRLEIVGGRRQGSGESTDARAPGIDASQSHAAAQTA